MIRLISARIQEVRGVRDLSITFSGKSFAISGPNGSGKSGVIDAIEFGLTGRIGRLSGRGTKGLSVAEHGPHVDKTKFPDAAQVTLELEFPALGKTATVVRKVSAPTKLQVTPPDSDILAALSEVADHPEITLSRRELLRYILAEPTRRSEEIQAVLQLDTLGKTRSALNTARNRLQSQHRHDTATRDASGRTLSTHLGVAVLTPESLLAAVNPRRQLLGLPTLTALSHSTRLDSGLTASATHIPLNKSGALRDIAALESVVRGGGPEEPRAVAAKLLADLATLDSNKSIIGDLERLPLLVTGLGLATTNKCPLCDTAWPDAGALRAHIQEKLTKAREAEALQERLLETGQMMASEIQHITAQIPGVATAASSQHDLTLNTLLADWKDALLRLQAGLATVTGIVSVRARLATDWRELPDQLAARLELFRETVASLPDQTATVDSQTFLTTAQIRLNDFRTASLSEKASKSAWQSAQAAYDAYCSALEGELNQLYAEIEADFGCFYRAINGDDESQFTAKLTPSEGSLGLEVNFYERGLFPPAAFHSEGHQDGMGVCLYLALMKKLFGKQFTLALLDDVVMSVDSAHRYEFCKLLKAQFPDTQFILTTHDRVWAEQMKSAGIVSSKTSLVFRGWTVDTGPLVASSKGVWADIDEDLAKNHIPSAAATLRHHLEYLARSLADQLGATVLFKGDGTYELGDLLPSAVARLKDLYGKAIASAHSWGHKEKHDEARDRKDALGVRANAANVEQWAVNKAVHYNEWANFTPQDFVPVRNALQELVKCFQCSACDSLLYVSPRGRPDTLRCTCAATSFNLVTKPKD